jgi:hypothetical protein
MASTRGKARRPSRAAGLPMLSSAAGSGLDGNRPVGSGGTPRASALRLISHSTEGGGSGRFSGSSMGTGAGSGGKVPASTASGPGANTTSPGLRGSEDADAGHDPDLSSRPAATPAGAGTSGTLADDFVDEGSVRMVSPSPKPDLATALLKVCFLHVPSPHPRPYPPLPPYPYPPPCDSFPVQLVLGRMHPFLTRTCMHANCSCICLGTLPGTPLGPFAS